MQSHITNSRLSKLYICLHIQFDNRVIVYCVNFYYKLEQKCGTTLKTDVPTCWNSTFTIFKPTDKNFLKVVEVLIDLNQQQLAATLSGYQIKKLVEFLEP